MAKQIANPWLREQLMKRGIQMIDLAVLIGLPPHGPSWISEHVNRLRSRPAIERGLARYFHLSRRQLRARLWPAIYPTTRVGARARPIDAPLSAPPRLCVDPLTEQESR